MQEIKVATSGLAILASACMAAAGGSLNVPSDYATIAEAVSVATSGDEIVLATGPYSLAANLTVPAGVTIRSSSGNRDDVVINPGSRYVSLVNANSRLLDLTFSGGGYSGESGAVRVANASASIVNCRIANWNPGTISAISKGAVWLSNGIVSNCCIEGCSSTTLRPYASGITIQGGVLVDSTIRNCRIRKLESGFESSTVRGAALRALGGKIINCLIANNSIGVFVDDTRLAAERCFACGVYAEGQSEFVNCTVVENTYSGDATGRVVGFATSGSNVRVRNCAILDNGNSAGIVQNIVPDATIFDHCALSAAEALGCTDCVSATRADLFFSNGVYMPTGTGSLCDAGSNDYVPNSIAEDILGNSRISGSAVDIGAVELNPSDLHCYFTATATKGHAPLSAMLEANIFGNNGAVTYRWDLDGDGVYEVEGADKSTVDLLVSAAGTVTVTLLVEDGLARTKSFSQVFSAYQTIYVNPASTNPVSPYGTPETAATSISSALTVATAGATVRLAAGTYSFGTSLTVPAYVRIEGATGCRENVILDGNGSCQRVVFLTNDGASIANLTVMRGKSMNAGGGGVYIDAADTSVTNCVIRDCSSWTGNCHNKGIAVYNCGGLLLDTVITGTRTSFTRTKALALYQVAGTADRCIVTNNVMTGTAGLYPSNETTTFHESSPVIITGGRMSNCLVAWNSLGEFSDSSSSENVASGVLASGAALLLNNLVCNNSYMGEVTDRVYGVLASSSVRVENCAVLGNGHYTAEGELDDESDIIPAENYSHCAASDVSGCTDSVATTFAKSFAPDGKTGLLKHVSGSPLLNAGISQPLLESGLDLVGKPRVFGRAIDIGPFESDLASGFLLIVR